MLAVNVVAIEKTCIVGKRGKLCSVSLASTKLIIMDTGHNMKLPFDDFPCFRSAMAKPSHCEIEKFHRSALARLGLRIAGEIAFASLSRRYVNKRKCHNLGVETETDLQYP